MIEIVHKNRRLAELLSTEISSIYFSCVLDDSMKGRVWADNLEKPSFAVVWNEYQQGFQLIDELAKGKSMDKILRKEQLELEGSQDFTRLEKMHQGHLQSLGLFYPDSYLLLTARPPSYLTYNPFQQLLPVHYTS